MAHHTRNPDEPGILIVCFINDSASAPRNLGAKDQAKGARGSGAELLGHLELREKRAKTRPKSPEKAKRRRFQELNQLTVEMHEGYPLQQSFCGGCWGAYIFGIWSDEISPVPSHNISFPFSRFNPLLIHVSFWSYSWILNDEPNIKRNTRRMISVGYNLFGVGYAEPWIRVPLTCSINIAFGGMTTTINFVFYT